MPFYIGWFPKFCNLCALEMVGCFGLQATRRNKFQVYLLLVKDNEHFLMKFGAFLSPADYVLLLWQLLYTVIIIIRHNII